MREIQLAGCVIRDDQDRVLLLHRNTPKKQHWEIPGGKVEPGEDARTTAARELLEEMGVEVELERKLGACSFVEDGNKMVYTWFLARIYRGSPKALESDTHDCFEYLPIAQLVRMTESLSPNTVNFVNEVTDGRIRL
jgi:8-oxo-dGTP diphosphatase